MSVEFSAGARSRSMRCRRSENSGGRGRAEKWDWKSVAHVLGGIVNTLEMGRRRIEDHRHVDRRD